MIGNRSSHSIGIPCGEDQLENTWNRRLATGNSEEYERNETFKSRCSRSADLSVGWPGDGPRPRVREHHRGPDLLRGGGGQHHVARNQAGRFLQEGWCGIQPHPLSSGRPFVCQQRSINRRNAGLSGTPSSTAAETEYSYQGWATSCYEAATATFKITVLAAQDVTLSTSLVTLTEGGADGTYTVRLPSAPTGRRDGDGDKRGHGRGDGGPCLADLHRDKLQHEPDRDALAGDRRRRCQRVGDDHAYRLRWGLRRQERDPDGVGDRRRPRVGADARRR